MFKQFHDQPENTKHELLFGRGQFAIYYYHLIGHCSSLVASSFMVRRRNVGETVQAKSFLTAHSQWPVLLPPDVDAPVLLPLW
jgi:hypothetical protein